MCLSVLFLFSFLLTSAPPYPPIPACRQAGPPLLLLVISSSILLLDIIHHIVLQSKYMSNITDTIKQDLGQFGKLDQNRKMAVFAIVFVLFVVSVVVGAQIAKNGGLTSNSTVAPTSAALENAKPTTMVALSPSNGTLKVGKVTKVEVVLSKLAVSAADIDLLFDPKLVTISNVVNGVILPRYTLAPTVVNGRLSYHASLTEQNPTDRQEGVLFTFDLTPVSAGKATVDFDLTKTITAVNGDNLIGTTVGGIYTIEK